MEKIKIELVSITDYALSKRKARNTKLDDIHNIVDWAVVSRQFRKINFTVGWLATIRPFPQCSASISRICSMFK